MSEATEEPGMIDADAHERSHSLAPIYQAAHDAAVQLVKCDMCGERYPAAHFERLADICPERLWCRKCREKFAQAEHVSAAINKASDEVTASIQKYIRTLASNVDLKNPHQERLLTRAVNFYRKAKLVFARDTDEGRRKSEIGLGNGGTLMAANYVLGNGVQAWVDTEASMSDFGDPELDGIPRQQGVNGQETMGSRMARELMPMVQGQVDAARRLAAANEEANRLKAIELGLNQGQSIAVPVPSAPKEDHNGTQD